MITFIIAVSALSTPAYTEGESPALVESGELWAREYHALIEAYDNAEYSDDRGFSLIALMEMSGKDEKVIKNPMTLPQNPTIVSLSFTAGSL